MYSGQAIEITCISYNFILMESCNFIYFINICFITYVVMFIGLMNIKNLLHALICNFIVGARQSLHYVAVHVLPQS